MTQVATRVELVEDEETRLWNAFVIAEVRKQEAWRIQQDAWRIYVMTSLSDKSAGTAWKNCIDMHDRLRDERDAAYVAWKRVAYPQYNIPYSEDDESS